MKQILASLLATYTITNGQQIPVFPPPPPVDVPALINIASQAPQTTAGAQATSSQAPMSTAGAPAATTKSATTSRAPVTTTQPISGTKSTVHNPVTTSRISPGTSQAPISSAPPATTSSGVSPATTGAGTTTPPYAPPGPTAIGGGPPLPPVVLPPGQPATTGTGTGIGAPPVVPPGPSATTAPPPTPAPTMNPYCTPGLAQMAQQSLLYPGLGYTSCSSYTGPESIAMDTMGILECVDGGCCMCSEISCGLNPGMPCNQISFGDFSAAGVQNIKVKGSLAFGTPGFQQGAIIDCGGQQSCRSARIVGELIGEVQCTGIFGCNDANIVINDPAPLFSLQCEQEGGCAGASIEINIRNCASFAELGQFQFNGPMAASGASITVNNYCPNPVIIEHLDCNVQGSCTGTSFRFNGLVQIQNCEIFGAATLPPQCFGPSSGFGGIGGFPQVPPQQFPQYPQLPPFGQPNNPNPGFGTGFPQYPQFGQPQQPSQQFPGFPQGPLPLPPVQQPQPLPPVQQPPIDPLAPPQLPANPVTPPAPQPPIDPLAPPQMPPLPAAPAPPQQPAVPAPGAPQLPTPGAPGFGQPSQQVPGTGFGQPQQPGFGQPGMPGMPGMGFGAITAFGGQCEFAGQCSGPQTVTLQSNRFELACAEMGSCSGLSLTLQIPAGGIVDTIEAFRFEAPLAANGATITINSAGGFFANPVEISRIICEVGQSCTGLIIKAPGVDLSSLQVECREVGACTGGSINGISFDMLAGGNFQGGGLPIMPGFGAPQQPQQPGFGQPQQPGFGAPQTPQTPQQPFPGFGAPQMPQAPQQPSPGFGAPHFPQQPQFPQQPGFGAPQQQYPQYPPMGFPYYPQI